MTVEDFVAYMRRCGYYMVQVTRPVFGAGHLVQEVFWFSKC